MYVTSFTSLASFPSSRCGTSECASDRPSEGVITDHNTRTHCDQERSTLQYRACEGRQDRWVMMMKKEEDLSLYHFRLRVR